MMFQDEVIGGRHYRRCYVHMSPADDRELSDSALELVGGVFAAVVPIAVPEGATASVALFTLRGMINQPGMTGLDCVKLHVSETPSPLAPRIVTEESALFAYRAGDVNTIVYRYD